MNLQEQSNRAGRKPTSEPERVRDSIWVHYLQQSSDMPFATLERQYMTWRDGIKPDRASGSMSAYAEGTQGPKPPSHPDSPITWADQLYPGTASIYNAFVWALLIQQCPDRAKIFNCLSYADRTALDVRRGLEDERCNLARWGFPYLSEQGLIKAVGIPHLDALGLLLLQVVNRSDHEPAWREVFYARQWLKQWTHSLPHILPVKNRLLAMLESQIPRLGKLLGKLGIDPQKSVAQDRLDVDASESWIANRIKSQELTLYKEWASDLLEEERARLEGHRSYQFFEDLGRR